ncbi:MAG: YqcI/YcgG family protein [Pseudomonadota bacterium]
MSCFNREDVIDQFAPQGWQRVVFAEFEAAMTSRSRPFPCVFGQSGFRAGRLRFAFPDPLSAETLAPILHTYLREARDIGSMTSLVVFARPGPVLRIDDYRRRFWDLLDELALRDPGQWPADIPRNMDEDLWEFCFAGEPVFVVCNTPAHVLRQSRRATSFTITFQPRWVFDGITNTTDPAAQRSLAMVRERLDAFDALEAAPFLGTYGEHGNREYQQYFLDDTNEPPACPFRRLATPDDVVKKGKVA